MKPRVLIVIKFGLAYAFSDKEVDVEVFDADDYAECPELAHIPPPHFKDLCEEVGIPYVATIH